MHRDGTQSNEIACPGFFRLVYTERVGGSNPSPPTSLRSSKLRLGAWWQWLSKVAEERMTRKPRRSMACGEQYCSLESGGDWPKQQIKLSGRDVASLIS